MINEKVISSVVFQIIVLLIFSVATYYGLGFDDTHYVIDKRADKDFFSCLYYCFMTQSTLGYSDTYPVSKKAKILNFSHLLTALLFIPVFM